MQQISNSDYAQLCRVLKTLTSGESGTLRAINARRLALVLLKKFERKKRQKNG